jgi:membrane-bound metal-dependent hydrolase YbcI (DUF457 family)
MFAINHASAALLFKKKYPDVKLVWLLISVQLVELLWVLFNYIGLESTTTEDSVKFVGDIHLSHMPFSHSILSTVILAGLAYILIKKFFNSKMLATAISLAISSHIILDLLTHNNDLPLSFFSENIKLGSMLYSGFPYLAFLFEMLFGVFCWWYYKGSKSLLAVIIIFNLFNFTIFSPDVVGLEQFFVHSPYLLTSVIFFQIIVTLYFVWLFAKKTDKEVQAA